MILATWACPAVCHPQCQTRGDVPVLTHRAELHRSMETAIRKAGAVLPWAARVCTGVASQGVTVCTRRRSAAAPLPMPQRIGGTGQCKVEPSSQSSFINHPTTMAVEDLHCQIWAPKGKSSKGTSAGIGAAWKLICLYCCVALALPSLPLSLLLDARQSPRDHSLLEVFTPA